MKPTPFIRATAVALAFLIADSSSAQDLFDTFVSYDTGTATTARHPYDVEAGDYDGDGDVDLAVVNWWSYPKLCVLFNDGTGVYSDPVLYAGQPSYDLESADLDGDGDLDIVVSNSGSNGSTSTLSVYRNQGDGSFASQQIIPAGGKEPIGLALADYDADGDVDIAVAIHDNSFGTKVALLLNTGPGFAAPVLFEAGPNVGGWTVAPYALAAGDLNGDSRPDVIVGNDGMWVSVLMNTGGSFGAPAYYDLNMGPIAGAYPCLLVEDIDQDGDLDVLYSNHLTETYIYNPTFMQASAVGLLRNDGSGVLPSVPEELGIMGGKPGFCHMVFADVTGDGWKDICGTFQASEGWAVLASDGAGGFEFGKEYPSGQEPMALAAFDAEGDGDQDVVIVSRETLEAAVHMNPGNGDFKAVESYQAGKLTNRNLDLADIDGDGDVDVASCWAGNTSGGIDILFNTGGGVLAPTVAYPSTQGATLLKLRDLNGDSSPDLVWADDPLTPPYDFKTRLNNGNGTFGPQQNWFVGTCGTYDLQTYDLDADGDQDVLLGELLACFGVLNKGVHIRLNNGNGTFAPPYVVYGSGSGVRHIQGADFDDDGILDLALSSAGAIELLPGKGDGTFFPYVVQPLQGSVSEFVAADLDGDGIQDLAGIGNNGGSSSFAYGLVVMFGRGDFSFKPAVLYPGSYTNSVAIDKGDPDQDGDVDIMLANHTSATFSFFENKGDGTFERQIRYGTAGGMTDLRFADVTGDGKLDGVGLMGVIGTLYSNGSGVCVVPGRDNGCTPRTYCVAKSGLTCATPAIGFAGEPSASATSGFVIDAMPARSGRSGLFLYTDQGRAEQPFQGGTLCLSQPIRRSPAVSSGGGATNCDGVFSIDWNSFAQGILGGNPQAYLRDPGQQVNVQVWGRDSLATGSFLSDGLELTVCP